MPNYLINKQKDEKGYNEVHRTDCSRLPDAHNRVTLGWFSDANKAVDYAKSNGYTNADGCWHCSSEAHHG